MTRSLDALLQDARLAARRMKRRPGFTAVVILCLGLGIGATTGVFSVAYSVLLEPLPFKDPGHLYQIAGFEFDRSSEDQRWWIPTYTYEAIRDEARVFDGLAGFIVSDFDLVADEKSERLSGARTQPGSFASLGVEPLIGRTFLPEDAARATRVAIISETLWRGRFGGDPNVLDRSIHVSGYSHTIVGVLRNATRFPRRADLWTPLYPGHFTERELRAFGNTEAIGRLREEVTVADMNAELDAIARRVVEREPDFFTGTGLETMELRQYLTGDFRAPLAALFAASFFVLAIAVANVVNLLLARAQSEAWERAVRTAMGASRWRLFRQGLVENFLLAGAGGAVGIVLAQQGVASLIAISPVDNPAFDSISFSPVVLGLAFGVMVIVAVVMAAVPLLPGPNDRFGVLRDGGRGGAGRRLECRAQQAFVVSQVAVSLVLLVGAALMAQSFRNLQKVDPGFNAAALVAARVSTPATRARSHEGRISFINEVLDRVRSLPGVAAAGAGHILPLDDDDWSYAFSVQDRPPEVTGATEAAIGRIVTPGFFEAMGVPLLQGRTFTDTDRLDAPRVAVVSRAFKERYWPGETAVGKRIKRGRYDRDIPWLEIVGVVDDIRSRGLAEEIRPAVYYPMAQTDNGYVAVMALVVGADFEPQSLVPSIRTAVAEVSPTATVFRVITGRDAIRESLGGAQFNGIVLLIFAGVGVVLSATGIYGVTAHSVGRRTREFGLRIAIGAEPSDVTKLVVRGAFLLAGSGVALGLFGAAVVTRFLSELLFEVAPFDASTYLFVATLLGSVVLLASYLPARRVTSIDPTVALREE